MQTNTELIQYLTREEALKSPHIIDAFMAIDRKNFVPIEYQNVCYEDRPLPIGYGQTISQPSTVAFMLELLAPKQGNNILDIGSGSGWQTSLLAHIVGAKGHVHAIELIPELKALGDTNIAQYGFIRENVVRTYGMDAHEGLPSQAPFDRIIAAASATSVPPTWKDQLKTGGTMVIPIADTLAVYTKTNRGQFTEKIYPGFAFVPFVSP